MARDFAKACFAVAILVVTALTVNAADIRTRGPGQGTEANDARALAARIDAALSARWSASKIRPVALAEDGEFARRASLDLIGKIPAASEARDFIDDPSGEKRQRLIERLLESPAYTTRAAEIWRQLLLPEADTEDQARQFAGGFEAWLRRKVAEDAGYDRIVREILTAKLNTRDAETVANRAEPSPTAYYLAKEGKPENLASGVSRVFLGVKLECAQCHDHPFATWKREQFWSFAAFFAGTQAQQPENTRPSPRDAPPLRELTIPGTKKVVQAGHLDGTAPAWRPRADNREILAEWITAPENPYFARAIVNRVWARFFGVGLVESVDDHSEEASTEFKEVLDVLAGEFRAHGYNLKYLIRVITATRAYSLSSLADPSASASASASPMFNVMAVRGLSAGQLYDSLIQATGTDAAEARSRFLDLFANRDERSTEAQTSILQALTLMNGNYIAGATNVESGETLGAIAKSPFLDTPGRIETLYLATLSRRPRPDESALLVPYVDRKPGAEDRSKALADVFWAILNGPEFYLNH